MHELLVSQLAADFCVTSDEVLDSSHHFTIFEPHPDRRKYMEIIPCLLKIAVVNGKLLFTGRADIIARCQALYASANAPWFMEAPNLAALDQELSVFGACIRHARPFYTLPEPVAVDTGDITLRRYTPDAIVAFKGDERFGEAFGFCETAPDMLGVSAEKNGVLLGMAGASADSPHLWQIGINVESEARGHGVASTLVRLLANDVLAEGRMPYYGTSISHLESQRVALNAGFKPSWFELVAGPK